MLNCCRSCIDSNTNNITNNTIDITIYLVVNTIYTLIITSTRHSIQFRNSLLNNDINEISVKIEFSVAPQCVTIYGLFFFFSKFFFQNFLFKISVFQNFFFKVSHIQTCFKYTASAQARAEMEKQLVNTN